MCMHCKVPSWRARRSGKGHSTWFVQPLTCLWSAWVHHEIYSEDFRGQPNLKWCKKLHRKGRWVPLLASSEPDQNPRLCIYGIFNLHIRCNINMMPSRQPSVNWLKRDGWQDESNAICVETIQSLVRPTSLGLSLRGAGLLVAGANLCQRAQPFGYISNVFSHQHLSKRIHTITWSLWVVES